MTYSEIGISPYMKKSRCFYCSSIYCVFCDLKRRKSKVVTTNNETKIIKAQTDKFLISCAFYFVPMFNKPFIRSN